MVVFIWLQIYFALTKEYDENIAHLLLGWLIWFGSFVAMIVIAIINRERLISNSIFLAIYMLLTNPISLWFVIGFIGKEYGFYLAT